MKMACYGPVKACSGREETPCFVPWEIFPGMGAFAKARLVGAAERCFAPEAGSEGVAPGGARHAGVAGGCFAPEVRSEGVAPEEARSEGVKTASCGPGEATHPDRAGEM